MLNALSDDVLFSLGRLGVKRELELRAYPLPQTLPLFAAPHAV